MRLAPPGPAAVETASLGDADARAAYGALWAASPQATVFHGLVHADAACTRP